MEKLFSFRLVEPHELPFFNTAKIRPQNKPKSDANRQKRKKTVFNRFRDKPARRLLLLQFF